MITLASQQLWIGLGIVGFLFVSLTMILIVLIQKPQGGGLSGAFGSSSDGGAGQTAFGAKTGDVLTTMTISIFVVFLVSAAGLNYLVRPPAAAANQQQEASTTDPVNDANATPAQPAGAGGAPTIQTEGGGTINLRPMDGPPPGFDMQGNPIPQPEQPQDAPDDAPADNPADGSTGG